MPCYDPETHERPERLQKKVHLLTRLLCTLCDRLEADGQLKYFHTDAQLHAWLTHHRQLDAERKRIEQKIKATGRESLTQEERWFDVREDFE